MAFLRFIYRIWHQLSFTPLKPNTYIYIYIFNYTCVTACAIFVSPTHTVRHPLSYYLSHPMVCSRWGLPTLANAGRWRTSSVADPYPLVCSPPHGMVLYKFNSNTSPSRECRTARTRTLIFVTEFPWSPFSTSTFPATGLVVVKAYCAHAPEGTRHCATRSEFLNHGILRPLVQVEPLSLRETSASLSGQQYSHCPSPSLVGCGPP